MSDYGTTWMRLSTMLTAHAKSINMTVSTTPVCFPFKPFTVDYSEPQHGMAQHSTHAVWFSSSPGFVVTWGHLHLVSAGARPIM